MGVFDKFMEIMGLNDEVEEEAVEERSEPEIDLDRGRRNNSGKNKVVPITSPTKDALRVVLVEPISFDDCQIISDHLKAKRSVIINLEALDLATARRIIDFVGGTAYALEGSMQKAGGSIFVAVPSHVEITGDLLNIAQPKEVIPWINQIQYEDD
ncbi:MAG: cell division protein SepF [Peptococcaceae bacterium]|jgi:cell division inhibitor SepF|nr:cell division protein SepF [Peptococcaceae bacterium]